MSSRVSIDPHILIALLLQQGGHVFINEDEIANLHPHLELRISYDMARQGYHLSAFDRHRPIDMGAAKVVDTISLPSPEEIKP